MRRKSLQHLRQLPQQPYGPAHPVARMIATGTRWFDAWSMQRCVPQAKLAKASGVPLGRLAAIGLGD